MRVRAFDDHITGGIDIDTRWVSRIGLHEPDDYRNIISNPLKRHRDGAVGLEKINGTTIVMGKGSSFGFERRVGGDERKKVLAD